MIRRLAAKSKKFQETVVLTHHFGGNGALMRRHQEFLSEVGYDSIAFDYSLSSPASKQSPLQLLMRMYRGAHTVWRRELLQVLNECPGDKFILSFSFPSCAVLSLLAENHRTDIKGWLSDGGPFLKLWTCMNNYFRYEKPISHAIPRALATAGGVFFVGSPFYLKDMRRWVKKIDPNFPILSIRGGRDELVPEDAIEEVFKIRSDLNLEVLRLPEAGHMQGLRKYPELYKPAVAHFLQAHSRI